MAEKRENEVFTKPHLLITEGDDDVRFFCALARHLGIVDAIQVTKMRGKYDLRNRLRTLEITTGFLSIPVRSLGIVTDADANYEDRFRSVTDALVDSGFPAPEHCFELTDSNPAVGICILPDPRKCATGELEDLCLKSVAKDPAIVCVDGYFNCLQEEGIELPKKLSKAKLQAFLASRKEVMLKLGEAADKQYYPWDNPVFDDVKDFLVQLVNVN
jgi:hypothetical protein